LHLNLYVPRLQIEQGVVGRFREHRGQPLPSAALMTPMSRNFVAKPERLTAEHEIPIEQFRNGRRKNGGASAQVRQGRKTPVFRAGKTISNASLCNFDSETPPLAGRRSKLQAFPVFSIGPRFCCALASDPASLGKGLSPPSCRPCSAHNKKPRGNRPGLKRPQPLCDQNL
jgi:hypothetical protein